MSEKANSNRSHRVSTAGNLSQSMRANYGEHGVDNYYKRVGASYRNPHFPGVRACIFTWLERWWAHEKIAVGSRSPLILDMACAGSHLEQAGNGSIVLFLDNAQDNTRSSQSGEVTVAIYEWWKRGVSGIQPSKKGIVYVPTQACDVGETSTTFATRLTPGDLLIMAADPYTQAAYSERTTLPCAQLTFRDISGGLLPTLVSTASSIGINSRPNNVVSTIGRIDMVFCSFALHLVESPSELFALLRELSTKARWLVVLAPHKKPEIKEGWGWVKWDTECWNECSMYDRREFISERVHCRVYRSINMPEQGHGVVERGE